MMISHHGEPDFGAAIRPSFIEAEILSSLDSLDAKIYEMAEAVISTDLNGFSNKLWALDNRKMYNHGLNDVKTDAKLF
jgi:3'-5' exoribonuclease